MSKAITLFKVSIVGILVQSMALICNSQLVPGAGAYTEDPKKILRAADLAIRKLESVSYDAGFEGSGAGAVITSPATGKVRLANLDGDRLLSVNLAAKGKRYGLTSGKAELFDVSFSGKTVYRLRADEQTLMRKVLADNDPKERDFGYITSLLGAAPNQLIMFEYIQPEPFERQMAGEVLEYEGWAVVNNVRCHVVYAEFDRRPDGTVRKQRWFIGIKDHLPRKLEWLLMDDKGRHGAQALTLANLRTDIPLKSQSLAVKLPKGYKIKDYDSPTQRPPLLAVGTIAPEWKLTDHLGKVHMMSNYRGKVVVMDFWATYCGPCVKTMPELQTLHQKYRERGVIVFGINSWEEGDAPAYFKDKGYTYELLLNGEAIGQTYRVSSMPTLYVIGIRGEIIYHGIIPGADLTTVIEDYLEEHEM
jgi:thiol-disulfide isomerase/thioredoxin